jgi:hypothetical protein
MAGQYFYIVLGCRAEFSPEGFKSASSLPIHVSGSPKIPQTPHGKLKVRSEGMMLKKEKSLGLGLCMVALAGLALVGQAMAYTPENDLMKIKGYSPEVIQLTETQRSRQEWKEASAPKLGPVERFIHNIYYGDWTGDIDQFGSSVIREK